MDSTGASGRGNPPRSRRQNPPAGSSRRARFFKNAGLFLGTMILVCVAAEGVLRLVYHPENIGKVIRFDPHLGWSLKPNSYLRSVDNRRGLDYRIQVNSLGMREREFSPLKQSGKRRILLIGDSITFGTGVDAQYRFSDFMGRALGPDSEVLNAGVCGWGTDQELIYYESFARTLKPDIVVLCLTMNNDVVNNMLNHLFLETAPKPKFVMAGDSLKLAIGELSAPAVPFSRRVRNYFKHNSRLLVFVKRRIDGLRYRHAMQADPECLPTGFEKEGLDRAYSHWSVYEKSYGTCFEEAWRTTEALIDRFAKLCRQDGAKLMVFAFPLKVEIDEEWRRELMERYDIDPNRFDFQKPYRLLAEFCRRRGLEFVYPHDEFVEAAGKRHLYFQNDSHPNQYGHAMAARALLETLRDDYKIPFTVAKPDRPYFLLGS